MGDDPIPDSIPTEKVGIVSGRTPKGRFAPGNREGKKYGTPGAPKPGRPKGRLTHAYHKVLDKIGERLYAESLVMLAMKGNGAAIRDVGDRVDPPDRTMALTGADGEPLQIIYRQYEPPKEKADDETKPNQ